VPESSLHQRCFKPFFLEQGIGRHSIEFVKRRMGEEMDACNDLLAKSGAFLTGDTPCQADCWLVAMVELV
jgi:glutathione S-transferase